MISQEWKERRLIASVINYLKEGFNILVMREKILSFTPANPNRKHCLSNYG